MNDTTSTDTTPTSSTDAANEQAVVIERALDAPIELVWRMWTDPEHFAAWYGPETVTVPEAAMDVRVGGARQVTMEAPSPDGMMRMHFTGEYLEVEPPNRLVYTEAMADEDGAVVEPSAMGMPADHPTVTTVTVQLRDLGGRTAMVLTHTGVPADSAGATGWEAAIDKLVTHLATAAD